MMFLQAGGKGHRITPDTPAKDAVMTCCTTHRTGTSLTSSTGTVKNALLTPSSKGKNSYMFSLPPDLLLPHSIPLPVSIRLSNLHCDLSKFFISSAAGKDGKRGLKD